MKNYWILCLCILFLVSGCKKKDDEKNGLIPSPDYPYIYKMLSQQEKEAKLQEFNAINTFESLILDEFGMLRGSIPVDMAAGLDSLTVKNNISFILKTYGRFLGITNSDSINTNRDIAIRLDAGVTVTLEHYFQNKQQPSPDFVLCQNKVNDRKIKYSSVSFLFSAVSNQMEIYGYWFPKAYVPEIAIKDQQEALNIAIQYIGENHKEVTPINLSNVEKDKFEKVIYPYSTKRGMEMRECWEIIFWNNYVTMYVDTQTGEVIDYLEYKHMI